MSIDCHLKLDGVQGESTHAKHKDEIQLYNWSWGASNAANISGGGMAVGKGQAQDLHFTKKIDRSSPNLLLNCATGEHIKSAVLVCRKAGKDQQEYLKITLSDVLVSSYQTGGNQGSLVPVDQLSFNFAKIEIEYKPQKADGSLDAPAKSGWDVKANKKV